MWSLLTDLLITAVSGLLNIALTVFYEYVLKLDTVTYVKYFPALSQGYRIFQVIGAGLVVVFAVVSLIEFVMPQSLGAPKQTDTVMGILFKTAIAGALVYAGNYILVWLLSAASSFYDYFIGIKLDLVVIDFATITSLVVESTVFTFIPGLSEAAALLTLLLGLLLMYNIFKMLLEVVERYFLVGVMIFTSPPFFAMFASSGLRQSFKSWVKMYISGLFMLAVSVFFSKVVLSGLHFSGSFIDTVGRLIFTFAMCKIAQQVDTYLKQLGLGTAETGRSLLEDIMAAGKSVEFIRDRASGQSGKSARTAILGASNPSYTVWGNTAIGRTVAGARARAQSYAAGGTEEDQSRAAAAAVSELRENQPTTDQVYAAINAQEGKPKNLGDRIERMSRAQKIAENADTRAKHMDPEETVKLNRIAAHREAGMNAVPVSPESMPQETLNRYTTLPGDNKTAAAAHGAEADRNYREYGALEPDGTGGFTVSAADGKLDVSPRAKASGVKYEPLPPADNFTGTVPSDSKAIEPVTGRNEMKQESFPGMLSGNTKAVADIIGSACEDPDKAITDMHNMNDIERNRPQWHEAKTDMKDICAATVENGSTELSHNIIWDANHTHSPADGMHEMDNGEGFTVTNDNIPLWGRIGAIAVQKSNSHILPTMEEAEYSNVSTFNTIGGGAHDVHGNPLHGGHGWTATVTDKVSGNTTTWVGISEAAYTGLTEQDKTGFRYDEKGSQTGNPQYVKPFKGNAQSNPEYRRFMQNNYGEDPNRIIQTRNNKNSESGSEKKK